MSTELQSSTPAALGAATELALQPLPHNVLRTRGDRQFDWIVYGGLGGVGTFLLTIPIAYSGKYGIFKELYEKTGVKLAEWGLKPKTAEKILETTVLSGGGTIMLLPINVAEHYRKPIVAWLNGHQHAPATESEEPPQTFGSLLKARATAWLTVFASFMTVDKLAHSMGNPDALKNFEERFANRTLDWLGKPTHIAGEETRAFRYGKLAALDVFATAAATTLLYAGSRFFARKREEKKERLTGTGPKDVTQALEPIQSVTPAPQANLNVSAPHGLIQGPILQEGRVQAEALSVQASL